MTREQGMAYYERMRKEVRELMVRKRLLDRNLVCLPLLPSLAPLPTDGT